MHNCYSNRVYMHSYYSMCICYFINFCSHSFFLSLLRAQPTNSVFLIFFFLRCTQTNTPTPIHKQTNQQRDRSELVGLDRCLIRARGSWSVLDRSSWVLTDAWSELVGLDRYLTGARLDRCLWNDWSLWVFCLNGAWPRWVLLDRS